MKNFYFSKLKMVTTVMALFISVGLFAQSTITWTGANSSDYSDPTNWDPQGNIDGNDVVIGHADSYTYPCIIDADVDVSVNSLTVSDATQEILNPDTPEADTIQHAPGEVTIHMATGKWFTENDPGSSKYVRGIINITGGNYLYNRNKNYYMDNANVRLNVDCDTFRMRGYPLLGKKNSSQMCVTWTLSGHTYATLEYPAYTGIDRFPVNTSAAVTGRPSLIIEDDAEMVIFRDAYDFLQTPKDSGLLTSTPDRDVVIYYDPVEAKTYINTRLKTAFVIEPIDRQILNAGEDGQVIRAIQNDGFASMESLEWKYGTTSGGPYDQTFTPAQTGDTIVPNFPVSGEYYLVLEGTKGGTQYYTNEVSIGVASNKAIVSPETTQNIRLGQQAEMLTVTEDGTSTGREWKYSTTPGGPYTSFDPAITGTEFTPDFAEVGTYFVVCISTVDGETATTKEVQFNILASTEGAMNLTFTGTVSDDAGVMFNWDPAAYIDGNNLIVPSDMNPVLSTAGNESVHNFNVGLNSTFIINKPSLNDTLFYTADHGSSAGSYLIEGGVFVKTQSYFRLYDLNTTFTVKNNAVAILNGTAILLGGSDNPANGANMIIEDNAIVYFNAWPGRISANKGYSEMRLSGNAKYVFAGDYRSAGTPMLRPQVTVSTVPDINGNDSTVVDTTFHQKFVTPEGFEPYLVYDPVEDITTITARDLSALAIEQTITQIVGLNQETNPLTLINSSAYTSFEWQYSKSAAGPWSSFETPKTGETATFAFDTAGVVFVRCLADGSVASSNAIAINTISVKVTPAGPVYVSPTGSNSTLTVELPEGVTGQGWKFSETSGSGYVPFFVPQSDLTYTPFTSPEDYADGTSYYLIFEALTTDDNGQDVVIYSNEVQLNVGYTAIDKVNLGNVSVYPNPARNAFFVDGGSLKSYELQVVNLQGAVVFNKSYNQVDGPQKVDFNKSGYYLIKLVADEGVKVGSLVIE
ncbi:T9SS type A sorting domain-containing protein [Saccharicrinis sp. FJH62]|uniref:T9SS type A sorting domain-containing protein n=1 Tax=Saccharicrinis sp. FJH62 TaxID=3344657 RepID=UPI0035D50E41